MGEFLLQIFMEIICYFTAKFFLPLLSIGRLQVLGYSTKAPKRWWGEPPFTRLSNGKLGVQADMAAFFGLILWVAAAVVLVLLLKR
jgi:hypothetical protein